MAAPNGNAVSTPTLTLQSSHRLTPRISLHTFSVPDNLELAWVIRVTLQFPPDLAGARHLTDEDRRLVFTPCHFDYESSGRLRSFSLLAGNGRVTGALGLPRPQGPLTAQLVDVGKGFPEDAVNKAKAMSCIAGGTGISPFLAMASAPRWHENELAKTSKLYWTIRGEDFAIVEYFLSNKILSPEHWSSVCVYVTAGEDPGGLPAGKTANLWQSRFESLRGDSSGDLKFHMGRIIKADADDLVSSSEGVIFFCGSKSLEWQMRMWTLNAAVVHCTER